MAEKTLEKTNALTKQNENRELATREPHRHLVPAVDIYETEEGLTLLADIPGVETDSLSIDVEDSVLTIKASTPKHEWGSHSYREFDMLDYYRQFRLSEEVDQERIKAELNHGVLTLVLPKAEKAKPKRIEVMTS